MQQPAQISEVVSDRSRSLPIAILVTARPLQWAKNLLVVAAAAAAGALGGDDVPGRLIATFASFCLIASAIYLINDAHDAPEDRLHPVKRFRPIAAGDLNPWVAAFAAVNLILIGLVVALWLSPLVAAVVAAYLVLTLSYTFIWRHVALLDVFAVASGFVLRAVAGGAAANIHLSRWFLGVVALAALLIATGKRRAELGNPVADDGRRRRVLSIYTERGLRVAMLALVGGVALVYILWVLASPVVGGFPWRVLTLVPFAVINLRYMWLADRGACEAPERLLTRDRPLLLAALAWFMLFALDVNARS